MCYFIHLKVNEEGKSIYAEEIMNRLSCESNVVKIDGSYPNYILTDGMCSCSLVQQDGNEISVDEKFIQKILSNKSIKNIEVSWSWSEYSSQSEKKLRMDVNEFIERNRKAELKKDTRYHLYDFQKYNKY